MTKDIFVTGAVTASPGKGITAASLGRRRKARGGEGTMAAGDRARAGHGERQEAVPAGRNAETRPLQGSNNRSHGTDTGRGVAVEPYRAVDQRGKRRYKAHHGAGQAAVHGRCSGQ